MGHYGRTGVEVVAPYDFNNWWKSQTPVIRDGCSSRATIYRSYADVKASQRAKNRIMKVIKDARSYECIAYDVGIFCYYVKVKKRKIVNHKVQEVTEIKEYKSKPKRIVKGGTLVEMHKYIIAYDARCYDPYEHGEEW